ncbi:MAG: class I tRNA ligase family protein, partial [Patescibacteria group bacterium]|nr:class I tRNA ligase family protein [Patescibacteria group bacterium]
YIEKFGADVLRMYLMFLTPFEQGGDFRDAGILGIERFLNRVWKVIANNANQSQNNTNENLEKLLHKTIKKVTEDIENLRYNTAISALMVLLSEFEKTKNVSVAHYSKFLLLLSPFAPHLAEEIWQNILDNKTSIHKEKWPKYDVRLIEEKTFELVVQINGKHRANIPASIGVNQEEAEKFALANERVRSLLANKKIKKVVFVPNRLINFVTELE